MKNDLNWITSCKSNSPRKNRPEKKCYLNKKQSKKENKKFVKKKHVLVKEKGYCNWILRKKKQFFTESSKPLTKDALPAITSDDTFGETKKDAENSKMTKEVKTR